VHTFQNIDPVNFTFDGILGLAGPGLSEFQSTPIIQTLVNEQQLIRPIISFGLGGESAELTLGGTNPDLFTGNFTYVEVVGEVRLHFVITPICPDFLLPRPTGQLICLPLPSTVNKSSLIQSP
jgi:hypothetical protein